MKNKTIYLFIILLFESFHATAQIKPELCPDKLLAFDNLQIQQSLSSDGLRCYLSLHPRDAYETMIYRDYLLTNDGLMMVFNSFSESMSPDSAGAREFYFLPEDFRGFSWTQNAQSVTITGFPGHTLNFSTVSAQIEEISGGQIKLAPVVNKQNKGGLEILSLDSIYFDAGFKTGDAPSADSNGSSLVNNSQNQSCLIKNSKVFNYLNDSVFLKEDSAWKSSVKSICPKFHL